jgi:hypothetical protein
MFRADFAVRLTAHRDRMLECQERVGRDHWKPATFLNQLADQGKTFT